MPSFSQTNILSVPATPPEFPTNQIAEVTSLASVGEFALNLLPRWDRTLTNSFGANELEIEVSPVWKTAAFSGSTPYLSIGATYFPWRHLGFGGEVITFGNGDGTSDLNSAHAFIVPRADAGNVAGYLLVGGGWSLERSLADFEVGGGLEYRYSNQIGIFADLRYEKFLNRMGEIQEGHELIGRAGITLHF